MKREEFAFCYVAYCDYNSAVCLGNAFAPGYYHVLDRGRHHIGEPIFNGCRRVSTRVGRTCIYGDAAMPDEDRV